MKLKSVAIRNFRSIREIDFEFPDSGMLVLVGSNNAGKSNIIRAIDTVCGETWRFSDKMDDHDFYARDRDRTIEIDLRFSRGRQASWTSSSRYGSYSDSSGPIYGGLKQCKEDFPCTYLGADRSFDKHLAINEWSLLGRVRKHFHRHAADYDAELRARYEDVVAVFDKVAPFRAFKSDFSRFFAEMQADTAAQVSVVFQPFTPANYFKTLQVLAHDPTQANEVLDLGELGEGSRNMVVLALLRSYARNLRGDTDVGGILALEEPEIYLHPQARRHLAAVLREIARAGIQVVISTHSSSFVDTEYFDCVGRVIKIPDLESHGRSHTSLIAVSRGALVSHCEATGVPAGKVTLENITEFYRTTSNPMLNEAFFARAVVLVEGETEELALPVYLAAVGINCDLLGISIIRVGGKNQNPKYWRLFGAFKIPMVVMFDNDQDEASGESSSQHAKSGNADLAMCFGLQKSDFMRTHSGASRLKARRNPATDVIVLAKDFETAVRTGAAAIERGAEREVEAWENEARAVIRPAHNGNKGQVARYVARKYCERFASSVPPFVRELCEALNDVGVLPPAVAEQSLWRQQSRDEEELPF